MLTGDTLVWMFWLRPNLDCYGQRERLLNPPELEKFDNQQWFNGFEMNFWQVFPAIYKKKVFQTKGAAKRNILSH